MRVSQRRRKFRIKMMLEVRVGSRRERVKSRRNSLRHSPNNIRQFIFSDNRKMKFRSVSVLSLSDGSAHCCPRVQSTVVRVQLTVVRGFNQKHSCPRVQPEVVAPQAQINVLSDACFASSARGGCASGADKRKKNLNLHHRVAPEEPNVHRKSRAPDSPSLRSSETYDQTLCACDLCGDV